jgi:hypothetical protein
MSIEVLEAEVLGLPAPQRSRLLERLIASLDADPEIKQAWVQEAERRDTEIDSRAVSLIPGEQALARLRSDLR